MLLVLLFYRLFEKWQQTTTTILCNECTACYHLKSDRAFESHDENAHIYELFSVIFFPVWIEVMRHADPPCKDSHLISKSSSLVSC